MQKGEVLMVKACPYTPPDYQSPDWLTVGRVHDWKNYITSDVQEMWSTFTDGQKAAIARNADEYASREVWE